VFNSIDYEGVTATYSQSEVNLQIDFKGMERSVVTRDYGEENVTDYTLGFARVIANGEHLIDGVTYGIEMQLNYRNQSGWNTIISFFFNQSEKVTDFNPILDAFVEGQSSPAPFPLKTFIESLRGSTLYAYTGSLSVPPCHDGVERMVFGKVTEVPPSQYEGIRN